MPPPTSNWPILNGFTIRRDASWSIPALIPSTSSTSSSHYLTKEALFHFPVTSAERLFCLSRGSGPVGGGEFQLMQSEGVGDRLEMKVVVEYWTGNMFTVDSVLRVCELRRGGNEDQFGIAVLTRPPPDFFQMSFQYHVNIKVIVTLPPPPPATGPASLQIRNFETDMPMFSHLIDNLSSTVYFRTISLRSSNAPIFVESINAGKADIKTNNAPIQGSFASNSSLKMDTSNGPIRVSVFLQSNDPSRFAELMMRSSNGPVTASIILDSPTTSTTTTTTTSYLPRGRGGNFAINASTQTAPISLSLPSAPESCNIHLKALTSLGPAYVSLPEEYEGAFDVRTSLGFAFVGFGDGMERRERRERRRLVFEWDGGVVKKGRVCSPDVNGGRWRGEVEVGTSIGPVTLRL